MFKFLPVQIKWSQIYCPGSEIGFNKIDTDKIELRKENNMEPRLS